MESKFERIRKDSFYNNVAGDPQNSAAATSGRGGAAMAPTTSSLAATGLAMADQKITTIRAELNSALQKLATKQKEYNDCNSNRNCRKNIQGYTSRLTQATKAIAPINDRLNKAIRERYAIAMQIDPNTPPPVFNNMTPQQYVAPVSPDTTSSPDTKNVSDTTVQDKGTVNTTVQKGFSGMSTAAKWGWGLGIAGSAVVIYLGVRIFKNAESAA